MIWFFTPYSFQKKLFEAYDAYMQVVADEHDWVCLMDGDAAFLLSDFGHQLQEYINKYPATGMFTCYASRCPYGYQVKAGVNQASDSVKYIFENTKTLRQQEHLKVTDLGKRVAGHLMLIQKKTWTKYRAEIFKQAESANIQAVDTAISDVLLRHNEKILLMQGLQVFHYYRQYSMTEKHILSDKLTVVIRTHDRPKAFKRCIESVRMQSHKNIDIIVGVDTPGSFEYVKPYNPTKIVQCKGRQRTGHTDFPANEYVSQLLAHITDGYILVLDDDNYIADPRGVEKLFTRITREICLYIIRYRHPNGNLFPNDRQFREHKIENGGVDWASCVFHARFKDVSKSKPLYNADFYFIQALAERVKVTEFIDLALVHTDSPGQDGKTETPSAVAAPVKPLQIRKRDTNNPPGSMDVVYVLGTGSRWNDNEIRFSLRSIEKNLKGFRNVFVVGECPRFLENVIHIPAPDVFSPAVNADGNIIEKVLAACRDQRLSDDFLFINDDHLLLQPVDIAAVPALHKGDMTTFEADFWKFNYWRRRLKNTMQVLKERGLPTLHFDCHTPIIFNKETFNQVMNTFGYQQDIGYTMKSLYGNMVCTDAELLTDQKRTVFRNYKLAELRQRLRGQFMAFNDDGLNAALKWWLIENFSEPTRFEKDLPTDKVFDLYYWSNAGKPWQEGVEIFRRYFKNPHLQELFDERETPALRKKLEFKMNLLIGNL